MEYVAKVSKDGKGWLIEFPTAPGCNTQADTEAEIPKVAKEAIEGWLESWLEMGEVPPQVKRQPRDGLIVPIDPALEVAIELRRARLDAKLTQTQVAQRAGVTQQQIAKLEKPGQNPSVDTIKKVAEAIGYRAVFSLVPTLREQLHP